MFFTARHALSSIQLMSVFQLRDECGHPFLFLDGLEGDAVNPGTSFVGADKGIGMTEDVGPVELVVQGVEAAGCGTMSPSDSRYSPARFRSLIRAG